MKKYAFLLILLVLGTLTVNVFAQKVKTSTSNTVVTSTFQDTDLTSNLFYTIRSDQGGDYVHGKDSVSSIIQGIGDWELDLGLSTTRKIFFDFGSEISGTNIDGVVAPASGAYTIRTLAGCSVRPGKRLQDLRIADGTIYCPVNYRLQVGSEEYSVRFRSVEFPGTNDVAWTCTSEAADGKCNAWRMESASGGSIARLLKLTTVKGKTTTKYGSLFYFTFKVDVKIP